MATYAMLTRLTPETVKSPSDLARLELVGLAAGVHGAARADVARDRALGAWHRRHAAISCLKRAHGTAVHVSVCACPNDRTSMTTLAATISSGASNRSR